MIKKLLKGDLNDVSKLPITEQDDIEIPDFPEGGITNAQMAAALTPDLDGFYLLGSVYLCTDNGEHGIKSHLYEFTSDGWVDVTPQFILKGASDPTDTTVGEIGQFYLNMSSSELFQCTAIVKEAEVYHYEWILRTGKYVIELSGESGTLTDAQFAQVINDSVCVEFSLDGRIFTYNQPGVNFVTYASTIFPTDTTSETKVLYINTSPDAVNYKSWTVKDITLTPSEEVIDIGNNQTTVDGVVVPVIDKADADAIYQKYTAGKEIVILWRPLSIDTYFSIVYATEISGYEIDCIIHGKVLKYSWTASTEGGITPAA